MGIVDNQFALVLLISCFFVVLAFWVGSKFHSKVKRDLIVGKIPSTTVLGTIKSIETMRGGRFNPWVGFWFLLVEAKDPFSGENRTYQTSLFEYSAIGESRFKSFAKNRKLFDQEIVKYVTIDDQVSVLISQDNSKIYHVAFSDPIAR